MRARLLLALAALLLVSCAHGPEIIVCPDGSVVVGGGCPPPQPPATPTPTPAPEPDLPPGTPEPTPAPTPEPGPACVPRVQKIGLACKVLDDATKQQIGPANQKNITIPAGAPKRIVMCDASALGAGPYDHIAEQYPECWDAVRPHYVVESPPDMGIDPVVWSRWPDGSYIRAYDEPGQRGCDRPGAEPCRGWWVRGEIDTPGQGAVIRACLGDLCSDPVQAWMEGGGTPQPTPAPANECVRIGLTGRPLEYLARRRPHVEPLDGCNPDDPSQRCCRWLEDTYKDGQPVTVIWDGCRCTKEVH